MSILLTTPFNAGDFDPANPSLTHVEISRFIFDLDTKEITVIFKYGVVDGSNSFSASSHQPAKSGRTMVIKNKPRESTTDFDDIMDALTLDGEKASSSNARLLYTHALVNGFFSGTPVDPSA